MIWGLLIATLVITCWGKICWLILMAEVTYVLSLWCISTLFETWAAVTAACLFPLVPLELLGNIGIWGLWITWWPLTPVKHCVTFLLKYVSFFLGASDDLSVRHFDLNLGAKEFELVVGVWEELVISDFRVFVENITDFVKFFILLSPALTKSFFTSETLLSVWWRLLTWLVNLEQLSTFLQKGWAPWDCSFCLYISNFMAELYLGWFSGGILSLLTATALFGFPFIELGMTELLQTFWLCAFSNIATWSLPIGLITFLFISISMFNEKREPTRIWNTT